MLFQCSYLDHSVPLKNVILHGLVRDANNQKMSKSLNNVVNPLDIVNEYGADTLRLFLLSSCPSSGQDIVFSKLQLKYY
jgi:valyl-tRNA synthetase